MRERKENFPRGCSNYYRSGEDVQLAILHHGAVAEDREWGLRCWNGGRVGGWVGEILAREYLDLLIELRPPRRASPCLQCYNKIRRRMSIEEVVVGICIGDG